MADAPENCNAVTDAQGILASLLGITDPVKIAELVTLSDITDNIDSPVTNPENNPLYEAVPALDIKDLTIYPSAELVKKSLPGTVTDNEGNTSNPEYGDMDKLGAALRNQVKALGLDDPGEALVLSTAIPALLQVAVQYNLNKDGNRWEAITSQFRARTEEIRAITARYELSIAKNNAQNNKVETAKNILELATTQKQYEIACSKVRQEALNETLLQGQIDLVNTQNKATQYQFMDTVDGVGVSGTIKRQNDLLDSQNQAYENDAIQKFLRLFIDVYAIDKSAQSDATTPSMLGNASTDYVLTELGKKLGLTSIPASTAAGRDGS